ncbi:MAG TPA: TRAP transporter small permease subunit, partial [Brevibacterium sp.]|nr:TRAP transporter small permease subunit [Brevibacterium sp.]
AGLLITMRGHITLEIVDAARSRLFVRIVQSGAMLIVAAIAIMLVVEAIALIESQGILKSAVLRIPMSWVYIPVLVGVASTAIRSLIQAVRIAVVGPMFTDVDDDAEVAA